jgi:hypothetical protein
LPDGLIFRNRVKPLRSKYFAFSEAIPPTRSPRPVDPKSEIYPTAAGTRIANAAVNRIMPFHPGAARFYAEAGIKLPAP